MYAAAGLFFYTSVFFTSVFFTSAVSGIEPHSGSSSLSRFMPRIDPAEGVERMANFRQLRLAGDYCFRFELEHLPRRGPKAVYAGTLFGGWNAIGPVSRLEIFPGGSEDRDEAAVVELIIQNGRELAVWMRRGRVGEFKALAGGALFEPIIPGVLYTPFDLQMPFIYWDDFIYEGPGRVLSRVAQWFRMLPPKGSFVADSVQAVRLGLDDTYDALLKVEVIGADGELRTEFKVESFKKVQQQYIVKEIALKDVQTRARTRFQVKAASVDLSLNPTLFDPLSGQALPLLPDSLFEEL
jgi:hypothetical protein